MGILNSCVLPRLNVILAIVAYKQVFQLRSNQGQDSNGQKNTPVSSTRV